MKANITVEGSVQGVGYRAFVLRTAQSFGITGFVRNLPNGGVEIFAQTKNDGQLKQFLEAIERKSSSYIGMHVEKLDVAKEGEKGFKDYGDFGEFGIRF